MPGDELTLKDLDDLIDAIQAKERGERPMRNVTPTGRQQSEPEIQSLDGHTAANPCREIALIDVDYSALEQRVLAHIDIETRSSVTLDGDPNCIVIVAGGNPYRDAMRAVEVLHGGSGVGIDFGDDFAGRRFWPITDFPLPPITKGEHHMRSTLGMGLGAVAALHASTFAAAAPMKNISPARPSNFSKAQAGSLSRGSVGRSLKKRRFRILRSAYGHTKKMKGGLYKGSTRAKNATRRGGNQAAH